jgi:hypothetical protein
VKFNVFLFFYYYTIIYIYYYLCILSVINQMKFNLTVLFSHLKILVDDGFLKLEVKTIVVLHHGQHF